MKFNAKFWGKWLIGLGVMIAYPFGLMATPVRSPLADGIYLFGQSPQSEQIGQEYLVFRIHEGKTTGAIYLPMSEFSCFSGTISPNKMNLSILDPYENTIYRHSIALEALSPVAAGQQVSQSVRLEGYYQIERISENDRRILQVCLKTMATRS